MDMQITTLASPTPVAQPAPQFVADKRATADTAALAHNPRPDVPMPIPPTTAQVGVVNRTMLSVPEKGAEGSRTSASPPITEIERTLKPYGVNMLPNREDPVTAPEIEENSPQDDDG